MLEALSKVTKGQGARISFKDAIRKTSYMCSTVLPIANDWYTSSLSTTAASHTLM